MGDRTHILGAANHFPALPSRDRRVVRACSVEPLEERVLFALAGLTGGGYSGTLSTNSTIRQQQLICDPAAPKEGSTSVRYDASLVHLSGYQPGPGYDNLGFLGFVEVKPPGSTSKPILQPLVSFLTNPQGAETGYVQVQYKLQGSAGQLSPPPGYKTVDEGGVSGVDTHALMFQLRAGVPTSANVSYQVYAARGNTQANNQEDYLLTNDGTNTRLGPADLTPAFVSTDQPPVITSTGGPYAIAEGASVTLHASATDADTAASSLSYAWDLNGDGVVDATGANPTVSAATLQALGLGDGPKVQTITLRVGDGTKTTSATAALTVNNVAPTASVVGADCALGAATASITLSATDPSAADRLAGFKYLVDWGDGSALQTIAATANNGAGIKVSHSYSSVGSFTVSVRAVDKDGGTSGAVSTQIGVSGARLQPDPSNPSKLALFVVGTNANDTIRFQKSGGGLQVLMNGRSAGTFKGFTRVIAYGLGGNDDIRLNDAIGVLFGGAGDDTLIAGNFQSILSGGDGNDYLASGNSKDLLLGGNGADRLLGGDGDDLLVAGRTSYDNGSNSDVKAISAILAEWASTGSYETHIAHITGAATGGLNGTSLLKVGVTVFDDAASDTVLGGNGRDWLFLKTTGTYFDSSDLVTGETGTAL